MLSSLRVPIWPGRSTPSLEWYPGQWALQSFIPPIDAYLAGRKLSLGNGVTDRLSESASHGPPRNRDMGFNLDPCWKTRCRRVALALLRVVRPPLLQPPKYPTPPFAVLSQQAVDLPPANTILPNHTTYQSQYFAMDRQSVFTSRLYGAQAESENSNTHVRSLLESFILDFRLDNIFIYRSAPR